MFSKFICKIMELLLFVIITASCVYIYVYIILGRRFLKLYISIFRIRKTSNKKIFNFNYNYWYKIKNYFFFTKLTKRCNSVANT